MKICNKCKIKKELNLFSSDKKKKDGKNLYCKECINFSSKKWRDDNPDKRNKIVERWKVKNKEKIKEQQRNYYNKNSEKRKQANKKWKETNKEKIRVDNRNWKKENSDLINSINAKRKAIKKRATPPWLTEEHYMEIRLYYKQAQELTKNTGIKHEVDHIVPLQGKNVRGLHVPWNLQVITAKENNKWNNRIKYD